MENKNIEKGKVCVSGGNGYVGSWLVMRLLQHGYSVNTTVRSKSNTEVGFLTDLPGAQESLKIFEADLNQPHSFRAAIEGCVGVFLVAHQMHNDTTNRDDETSTTSTLAILQACLDAKTVKRVVYTSSAAAAIFAGNATAVVDEDSWSDLDLARRSSPPAVASYAAAKTLTEKAALEFAERHGLPLVTLLPTFIHGPFVGRRCPASVYALMSMFFGDDVDPYKYVAGWSDVVHVDDVASAHVFLMECADAKGRYICSAVETTVGELYQLLCNRYPHYQIPPPANCSLGEIGGGRRYQISSKKLLETGFKYNYGLEEMYDGAIECCKKLGLL
ncbi:protein BRI1-5 ENHANCED 1-like [Salvia miltiorrhiza]|uniref:protein BRI1-5 ENHANCED 1-like n=1 Tax=Salvia miltiorrhiza TaxID=226208 RepID=UPI0025AD92D0|nr:protein BRI1-5 ENHANCED 1-like [Salvia miltiorrhiza]